MKRFFICFLVIAIGCTEQQESNTNQDYEEYSKDFPTKIGDSKTQYFIFLDQGGQLSSGDNSNIKQMKITLTPKDEKMKEEGFDLDTLGRVTRHNYIEYRLVNNEEISISIAEIFLYNSISDTLLEKIKYENGQQVRREMFVYRKGFQTHHYILDGAGKLIQKTEWSYNQDGKIFLKESVDRHGYMSLSQYDHHSNGVKSKSIHRTSKNKIVTSEKDKNDEDIYLAEYNPNFNGYHLDYLYNHEKSNLNKPKRQQNMSVSNTKDYTEKKEEIITSDSTKTTIYTEQFGAIKHNDIIISQAKTTETKIKKTFDKFENCIKSEIYIDGNLEKTYTIKIKYYR